MNNNPFERSNKVAWIGLTFFLAVPVAFISIMMFATIGGTALICLPFYIIIIFLFFVLTSSSPIIQMKTKCTDDGIEQPSLWGYKFLRWQDVKEIRNLTTSGITFVGSETNININPFLFKDPQGFLSEIRSRIPESAYPSDTEINNEIYRRKQNDAGSSVLGSLIALVLIIAIGENTYAVIFDLLVVAFIIYQIHNWLKYKRLQS